MQGIRRWMPDLRGIGLETHLGEHDAGLFSAQACVGVYTLFFLDRDKLDATCS